MPTSVENKIISNTKIIIDKYKTAAKKSGENFNIFKILNLTSNEVRTHSAFLAEILSKNGSHEMDNVFLNEFLKIIKFNSTFNINSYTVEVEKYIGLINENFDEGGRIDIILTDNEGNSIIIENKIYAGDQYKQLKRYYNFNPKAKIIYLTLDGKSPSKDSLQDIPPDSILNISYQTEILKWLEECKTISKDHNILRESLAQYIYLIRHLTHKTPNLDMENEIFKLIADTKEDFNAALKIRDSFNSMLNRMQSTFIEQMMEKNNVLYKTFNKGDFTFKSLQAEDEDGLFVGIIVSKDNLIGIKNQHPLLMEISDKLKKEFPFSYSNHNYLGWITPLGNKIRYDDLSLEKKYELYANKDFREKELNTIFTQTELYLTRAESIINSTV